METLPTTWRDIIETKPLPRNVQPGRNDERRSARAKALVRQLKEDPEVLYADASLPKHGTRATAVVPTIDKLVTGASIRTTNPAEAEVAVTLALAQPRVRTMVTDSKTAYASYRNGKISPAPLTILTKRKSPGRAVELVWFPAHSQVEGNALTDHYARELSIRAENEP